MTLPWAVLLGVAATAVFAFLTARCAAYVWGVPPISERLLRVLELRRFPSVSRNALVNWEFWALLLLLILTEWAVAVQLIRAVEAAEIRLPLLAHFVLAVAWLGFLGARYRRRPRSG